MTGLADAERRHARCPPCAAVSAGDGWRGARYVPALGPPLPQRPSAYAAPLLQTRLDCESVFSYDNTIEARQGKRRTGLELPARGSLGTRNAAGGGWPRERSGDGNSARSNQAHRAHPTQRALARGCRRRQHAAGRLPARHAAPHWHQDRLRWWRVRRMRGATRRRRSAGLPDAGGALRRWQRRNHRKPGAGRAPAPPATGVPRKTRRPVWLLHSWDDHGLGGAAAPDAASECASRSARRLPAICAAAPAM